MNEKQFNKLIEFLEKKQDASIGKAIEKHVNGGIRHLTEKADNIEKKIDDHIDEDRKWKEEAKKFREEQLDPIVETSENFTWLGKLFKGSLGFVILIGGAWAIIKGLFK